MSGRVVFFEDTGEQRTIKKLCSRCGVTEAEVERTLSMLCISPSGTAHYATDDGDTQCGIDATTDRWWWAI